jgi:hypothetical protein
MSTVKKRIFTLREAQKLIPEVRDLTERAAAHVENLQSELESMSAGDDRRDEIETETQSLVRDWAREIEKLGCEAKGLWLVDFDSGDGIYYCWQHPENDLGYFHDYDAGFAGRRPLGPMLVN